MTPQLGPQDDREAGGCELTVENIGGIDACRVELDEGVTLLAGRNATNRTSFLRALSGALGGGAAALKADADRGRVEFTLNGDSYTREYVRNGDEVVVHGEPYTEQSTLVDLFVTVLGDNEARRAVEDERDLRRVIMRPVDTEAIERRIAELQEERSGLRDELAESEAAREELPNIEARQAQLEGELGAVESEIETIRADVAEDEAALRDASAPVDELEETRRERQELRDRIDVVEAELTALREQLADLRDERASLPEAADSVVDLDGELEGLRSRKRQLDDQIASLTTVVEFNEDVLTGEALLADVAISPSSPTDGLAPESAHGVVCWTCGSEVQREGVADRLDDLRAIIDEKRERRADVAERLADLEQERRHVEQVRERRQTLDREIRATERKIDDRQADLGELTAEAERIGERIQALEEQVTTVDAGQDRGLLEMYEALGDYRYERRQLETELSEVRDDIAAIEETRDPSELAARIDEVSAELERERTRVEELELRAVESFNGHMAEILDVLGYENLTRVWIERRSAEDEASSTTSFELHIVREAADGSVYEDRLEHLSESEREVVGLVVTLAGYLVHDVADTVPFMLLDSLETIDAARIDRVVDHF